MKNGSAPEDFSNLVRHTWPLKYEFMEAPSESEAQEIPRCNGLVTGPGPQSLQYLPTSPLLPPPFYLPSALQSVLALLKVLLTCNDLGERNALKNVTREWTKCQQKVTLYSTVTAISIYPATTISLCCKFNKLSERLKQCLCVSMCVCAGELVN